MASPPTLTPVPRPSPLSLIRTMSDIATTYYPSPHWILPGIIPEGLTVLASRPKCGKSWWMLDIASSIAAPSPPTPGSPVLYLALEDTERRLKQRGEMMDLDFSPNLHVATQMQWPRLNDGGSALLVEWLESHPASRLVIIDTLAKVKPLIGRGADVYASDDAALSTLKRIADHYRISIIIVTHLRKLSDFDDPFLEVSGSAGIVGAADTILVLHRERESNDATLHITGRDIDETSRTLHWNPDTCRWIVDARQTPPIITAILILLKHHTLDGHWEGTTENLRDLLPPEHQTINTRSFGRLLSRYVIGCAEEWGLIAIKRRSHGTRLLSLTTVKETAPTAPEA